MKKAKMLALVLVFAFALLGGAYATIFDQLFINEKITTAMVDVSWVLGDKPSSDPGKNASDFNTPTTRVLQGNNRWKNWALYDTANGDLDSRESGNPNVCVNVGSKNVEIAKDEGRESLPDYAGTVDRAKDDLLTITLSNGYPGYQEEIVAGIKNNSDIPVKFEINPDPDPDKDHNQYTLIGSQKVDQDLNKIVRIQIVSEDGTKVYYDSTTGTGLLEGDTKLQPGETKTVRIVERILESAPQKAADIKFGLQLRGIQWNEYNWHLSNDITTPDD